MLVAALLFACAGCAVTPAPAWQADTHDALDAFTAAYLAGNARAADRYFRDARLSVAGTGRPDLVARIDLYRCAIGTAALDYDACAGAEASNGDLTEADRAYAGFLSGKGDPSQTARLPEQYRAVALAKDADVVADLGKVKDPVSRLVASGALFRASRLSPGGLAVAVDTASEQGWRRPLAAYLHVQLKLAEAGGDTAAVAALRKRIDLVLATDGRQE